MVSSTECIQERVANGVEWLDEVHPGWRDSINIDHLNMNHCGQCVCGQVFHNADPCHSSQWNLGYDRALILIDPDWKRTSPDAKAWAAHHGFAVPPRLPILEHGQEYDKIGAEWKRVIAGDREPITV